MRCSFCEFLQPEPFIMGCLYTCEPANHTHMNTWPWCLTHAQGEKRGRNIDLAWNPGVDHDFDAAECALDFPLRVQIETDRDRELQVVH